MRRGLIGRRDVHRRGLMNGRELDRLVQGKWLVLWWFLDFPWVLVLGRLNLDRLVLWRLLDLHRFVLGRLVLRRLMFGRLGLGRLLDLGGLMLGRLNLGRFVLWGLDLGRLVLGRLVFWRFDLRWLVLGSLNLDGLMLGRLDLDGLKLDWWCDLPATSCSQAGRGGDHPGEDDGKIDKCGHRFPDHVERFKSVIKDEKK